MKKVCTIKNILEITSIYISQVFNVNGSGIVLHILDGNVVLASPIHTCRFYFVFTYLFFFRKHRLFLFYIAIQSLYIVHFLVDVNGVEQRIGFFQFSSFDV